VVDKRKHKRRRTLIPLKVYDKHRHRLTGKMLDISRKGVMLVCDEPIKPETEFSFVVPLAEAVEGMEELAFEARSVWCEPDINRHFYNSGFRIEGISEKCSHAITNSFEGYLFPERG